MTEPHLFLYKAFISNCDADSEVGDWLARSLQDYRIGRSIVGEDTHAGRIPGAIGPIFTRQADDDLRPLSTEVVNALFGAQFLIVVASHDCSKSEQVNKEIRLFKNYHGESRILYLQIGEAAEKCFPAAALFHVDGDGALTGRETHPGQVLRGTPGSAAVLHRVAAYLLGVSVEDLENAEERDRWTRRVKWSIGSALLLVLCLRVLGSIDYGGVFRRAEAPTDVASGHSESNAPTREGSLPVFASNSDFVKTWPVASMNIAGSFSSSSQGTRGVHSPSLDKVASPPSPQRKTPRRDRAGHAR